MGVESISGPGAERQVLGFKIIISEFRKVQREPYKQLSYIQTVIKPTSYFLKVCNILSLEKNL